jgi:zinc protease
MPKSAVLFAALIAAGFGLGAVGAAAAPELAADSFTLANGLEVAVLPDHRAPIVVQMVWYKVGAADETPGKSGLAHFVEHLMFKGTKNMAPGEYAKTIAANGGEENAFTTHDYTGYYATIAADRLPLAMRLEADRMANLVVSDAVVLPEREVIIEERRSRIDNSPQALLDEQIDAALYLNEHYHIPTIGWEAEMHGLTTADATEFYHRWYAPNNAVLVVAGDVQLDQVKALAQKYFGPLPSRPVPDRARLDEPPKVAAIRLSMTSPLAGTANWSRAYLAPSYRLGNTEEAYPLQVLAEILGGSATSRLYRDLVLDKGLALGAGADYDAEMLGLSSFTFYAMPKKDKADPVEAEIDRQIDAVIRDGVTQTELDNAKKRLAARRVYSQDSLQGPARMVGEALAIGRSLDDVKAWPQRIAAVTVAQVNDAARSVLVGRAAVTGLLLPEPNVEASSPLTRPRATESVQ